MFFIGYTFKGQVLVFAGRVKIVRHSSCRTSAIFKYFCPLKRVKKSTKFFFVSFDSLRPQSTILQLCWDGYSWVEPVVVLSKGQCVLLKNTNSDADEARTHNPSVSGQALYH